MSKHTLDETVQLIDIMRKNCIELEIFLQYYGDPDTSEYVIIVYTGYLTLSKTGEGGFSEIVFPDVDLLLDAVTSEGRCLRRDWDKIESFSFQPDIDSFAINEILEAHCSGEERRNENYADGYLIYRIVKQEIDAWHPEEVEPDPVYGFYMECNEIARHVGWDYDARRIANHVSRTFGDMHHNPLFTPEYCIPIAERIQRVLSEYS